MAGIVLFGAKGKHTPPLKAGRPVWKKTQNK
jgi:hypothetical protein